MSLEFTRKIDNNNKSIYELYEKYKYLFSLPLKELLALNTSDIKGINEQVVERYQLIRLKIYRLLTYGLFDSLYDGKPKSINEISSKKVGKAFKTWAEGSRALEELLWACYNNGVETQGCCAGHLNDKHREKIKKANNPYLSILFKEKDEGKIAQLYDRLKDIDGVYLYLHLVSENSDKKSVLCIELGNFTNIGKVNVEHSIKYREEIFKTIAETVRTPVTTKKFSEEYKAFREKSQIEESQTLNQNEATVANEEETKNAVTVVNEENVKNAREEAHSKNVEEKIENNEITELPQVTNQTIFEKLKQILHNLKEKFLKSNKLNIGNKNKNLPKSENITEQPNAGINENSTNNSEKNKNIAKLQENNTENPWKVQYIEEQGSNINPENQNKMGKCNPINQNETNKNANKLKQNNNVNRDDDER